MAPPMLAWALVGECPVVFPLNRMDLVFSKVIVPLANRAPPRACPCASLSPSSLLVKEMLPMLEKVASPRTFTAPPALVSALTMDLLPLKERSPMSVKTSISARMAPPPSLSLVQRLLWMEEQFSKLMDNPVPVNVMTDVLGAVPESVVWLKKTLPA